MSCQIYLISPPKIMAGFFPALKRALATGKIAVFQLRIKEGDSVAAEQIGKRVISLCHQFAVPVIINDDIELTNNLNADGIHIGIDDIDFAKAKDKLSPNKIIGVSCYNSLDRAMELADKGANYVSFGSVYDTKTKIPRARAALDIFTRWSQMSTIPCVAIGGIDKNNCSDVAKAGADFIAVISAIWNDMEHIEQNIEDIAALIDVDG